MKIPVFLGGVYYEAGEPVDIGEAPLSESTCALLRAPENGLMHFSCYPGNLHEKVVAAAKGALTISQRSAEHISTVFVISSMVDARNNLDGQWLAALAKDLQLEHADFYSVGLAGCAGFHAGLRLASAMVGAGDTDNALIMSFDQVGEALDRVYGEGTDFIYVTGDAASACVVSRQPEGLSYALPGGVQYTSNTRQIEHFSNETDMRSLSALIKKAYRQADVTAQAINHFVCNNYTLQATQLFSQLAGLSRSKATPGQLPRYGHCFSSDNLINLKRLEDDSALHPGDQILLLSTGPFQAGACVITRLEC
ncbi:3-oxoacyl-[acyl-carrier-protein] synthase III C-terminal domain-containing protein [Pseudomonas sp. KNUC1026]|uniref:3-oxoacyl-[acyl-carrier-protein] synthase III C-terminal domain-containing protein n=1 Tax=Pseudomonas sp. KNUC1026 TaxID=2893890 RepID=UPI001F3C2B9D|nr:3-oxoacyl-[acyl-carrier-protein] synthase III C-terminal domain-containing protein [Pseudomonas sp. KNUC1026]UFH48682.1 MupB [Pseudomonas sp. KNUC1026]